MRSQDTLDCLHTCLPEPSHLSEIRCHPSPIIFMAPTPMAGQLRVPGRAGPGQGSNAKGLRPKMGRSQYVKICPEARCGRGRGSESVPCCDVGLPPKSRVNILRSHWNVNVTLDILAQGWTAPGSTSQGHAATGQK